MRPPAARIIVNSHEMSIFGVLLGAEVLVGYRGSGLSRSNRLSGIITALLAWALAPPRMILGPPDTTAALVPRT